MDPEIIYIGQASEMRLVLFLVAGHGFEPRSPDSDSDMLPLHQPAICVTQLVDAAALDPACRRRKLCYIFSLRSGILTLLRVKDTPIRVRTISRTIFIAVTISLRTNQAIMTAITKLFSFHITPQIIRNHIGYLLAE